MNSLDIGKERVHERLEVDGTAVPSLRESDPSVAPALGRDGQDVSGRFVQVELPERVCQVYLTPIPHAVLVLDDILDPAQWIGFRDCDLVGSAVIHH